MLNEFMLLVDRIRSSVVIVEGRKDRAALEKLGIGNIVTISGKPLSDVVEMAGSPVVVLTDFDAEGKKLGARLTELFERSGVSVDRAARQRLFKLTGAAHIEDIDAEKLAAKDSCCRRHAVETKKSEVDIHGQISAIYNEVHDRHGH